MKTDIVHGVESIEFGIPGINGSLPTTWERLENIAEGTVLYTTNTDTKTNITPEDKSAPIIVLYTPGDPDTFNFALLEFSPRNLQLFFNAVFDVATTKLTILGKKKYANLAIRVTSLAVDGIKHRFTYRNTQCLPSYANNFSKDGLVTIAVSADILAWDFTTGGQVVDALYEMESLKEDGSPINSTPPTVTPPANSTTTTATKSLVATVTAASPKTIVLTQWAQVSGPNNAGLSAPNALTTNATGLITGTYVFSITAIDSDGIEATGNTTIVATIA